MDDGKEGEGASSAPAAPDFERVEYASGPGGNRCQLCQGALAGSYYQVNGKVVCPDCRGRIDVAEGGLSRRERIIMASVYGTGAALVGSVVWYAVARLTGMEIGIIAIGIGLFVGRAVRKGSRARGGRGYQALAMILTYLSIVTSYVPAVVSGIIQHSDKNRPAASADGSAAPERGRGGSGGQPVRRAVAEIRQEKDESSAGGGGVRRRGFRDRDRRAVPGRGQQLHGVDHHRHRALRGLEDQSARAAVRPGSVSAGAGSGGRGHAGFTRRASWPVTAGDPAAPGVTRCAGCGADVGPGLLACIACGRIVHASQIKALVAEADAAEAAGDVELALVRLRAASELLPPASTQHAYLSGRVQRLSRQAEAAAVRGTGPTDASRAAAGSRWSGLFAPLAALIFKLKFVVTFLAANAKLLVLGLAKGAAFWPALLSFAAFGTGFGWRIAGGLLASLYVHELGHVAWCRRFAIPVSAPMLVPGVGAFVRLRHRPVDAHEDAVIGLAGPRWGLGASVVALIPPLAWHSPTWRSIAWWGAIVNLLNLIPFASLDGGRAFRALSRHQRNWAAALLAAAWAAGAGWPCAVLAGAAAVRGTDRTAPTQPDRAILRQYLVLAGLLAIVALVARPR
jgi:Zn-dependent protease